MTPLSFQLPPLFDYFATFLWALRGAIAGMLLSLAAAMTLPGVY